MQRFNSIVNAAQAIEFRESAQERKVREEEGFPQLEAMLPRLPWRLNDRIIDKLSSLLGTRNPLSHPVNPKEDSIWLLDNTAFPSLSAASGYQAEFVVAYFVKGSGQQLSEITADIAEKLGLGKGDVAEATIRRRLEPWVDMILPAHTVSVNFAGNEVRKLGPSGRNGISSNTLRINSKGYAEGQIVRSDAVGISSVTPFQTIFAGETGWGVISDIDDTIKITESNDPLGLVRNTFVEPAQAVAGMPELYKHVQATLGNPPFWYLSASPYVLYPFLREFREQFYPPGTLLLRDVSLWELGGLLQSLTINVQPYKVSRLDRVHSWFPKRTYVCIGDSTQKDPESYAEAYRKYPGWIKAIYIRKVTGVSGATVVHESRRNSDERFEEAFKGVPREVWHVFSDPAELYERVNGLVA